MCNDLDLSLVEIIARGIKIEIWRDAKKDAIAVWETLDRNEWSVFECTESWKFRKRGHWTHGNRTGVDDAYKLGQEGCLVVEFDRPMYCVAQAAPTQDRWSSKDVTPRGEE